MTSSPTLDLSSPKRRKIETRNAWRCVGLKEEYGEVRALPFRIWTLRGISSLRDNSYDVNWYSLDLYKGEITSSNVKMPTEAGQLAGTSVACGNRVYVLGGMCLQDMSCPVHKTRPPTHTHDFVFYLDSEKPDPVWTKAESMLTPHHEPAVVAAGEDIYIFGREGVEVYHTSSNIWEPIGNTSGMNLGVNFGFNVSRPVLFDSSGTTRILVHFRSDKSLRAYHFGSNRWECVDDYFGIWPDSVVILDGVLYCINFFPLLRRDEKSLMAYDLRRKKWMTVNWLSNDPLYVPMGAQLVYLGKDKWCIIQYNSNGFYYIKLKLTFVNDDDGIREIQAEPEPDTFVAFPDYHQCEIPYL